MHGIARTKRWETPDLGGRQIVSPMTCKATKGFALVQLYLIIGYLILPIFSFTNPAQTFYEKTLLERGPKRLSSQIMEGSVFIATTLDGKIADQDGGVDFLNEFQQVEPDEGDMGFSDFLASTDVIIMGRISFEKVVSFGQDLWAYGELPVVVWTRSNNVTIPDYLLDRVTSSSLSPQELFDDLQKQGKTRAYIDGGITIQRFLEAGLVHRMILTKVPLIMGSGISLFEDKGAPIKLRHIKTQSYRNGLVQSTYDVQHD